MAHPGWIRGEHCEMRFPSLSSLQRILLVGASLLVMSTLAACTGARSTTSLAVDGLALSGPAFDDSAAGEARSLAGRPSPAQDEESLQRARQAEVERALREVWAVATTSDRPGTRWEFRYWAEGGALTLLSFRHLEGGEGHAAPLDQKAFLPGLTRNLLTLLGLNGKEVTHSL